MPVTAKLSRKFYERLGDDIANELVDWFNAVDETYRTQLRELNELNWKRFQGSMDAAFAKFDLKFEQRFAAADAKLEQRTRALELRVTGLETTMERRFAALEVRIEEKFTTQARWAVALWLGTIIPLGGLMIGMFNFAR